MVRFVDGTYTDTYYSTIGVDFKIKTIEVDGKSVKLQIWDTAGQERFHTVTSTYYQNANGIIVVYDVTNHESFEAIQKWLNDVEKFASPDVCKILIGNKVDLTKNIQVKAKEAKALARKLDIPFMETSAKECQNVDEVFIKMAKALKKQKTTVKMFDGNVTKIVLTEGNSIKSESSCC